MQEKRVGTFTLGCLFLFIGISTFLSLFVKENIFYFLRFAPALFIVLGTEVLIYSFKYKNQIKLRYDGLAVFFVIMITVVSMICYTVSQWGIRYAQYTQESIDATESIKSEIEDVIDENTLNGVTDVYTYQRGNSEFQYILFNIKSPNKYSINTTLYDFEKDVKREEVEEILLNFFKDIGTIKEDYSDISVWIRDTEENDIYNISLSKEKIKNITSSIINKKLEVYG